MEKEKFIKLCEDYNIHISGNDVDKLEKFYSLIIQENEKYNLTSITDRDEVYLKHFLDSLVGVKYIQDNISILDIGCGAGFPSIPLSILKNNCKFTLIDSVNKKINFNNMVKDELLLNNINAIHGRCEDLAYNENFREKFDVVVSRAVASCNILLEYCIPFLKIGGKLIMYKGKNYKEEIDNAVNAINKLNCKLVKCEEVFIKEYDSVRAFVLFEKTQKTPKIYPRKQNKPRKQPL